MSRDPAFDHARGEAIASYKEAGWLEVHDFIREHGLQRGLFFNAALLKSKPMTTASYYDCELTDIGSNFMRYDPHWVAILVDPQRAAALLSVVCTTSDAPKTITVPEASASIRDLNDHRAELAWELRTLEANSEKIAEQLTAKKDELRRLETQQEKSFAEQRNFTESLDNFAYWAFCRRWDGERTRIRVAWLLIGFAIGAIGISYLGPTFLAGERSVISLADWYDFAGALAVVLPMAFFGAYFLWARSQPNRVERSIVSRKTSDALTDLQTWRARHRPEPWFTGTTGG